MKIYNHLKLLMLVSFALTVATMAAGNVDSRAAQAKAIRFLNSQTDLRFNASNANLKLTHAEQSQVNARMNDFYVFNCDGGGYVIVAGDDRAEEILGYGSGYFDMNNLPDNVAWWMDHYKEQMEYLLAHPKLQVQTLSQQMPGMLTASDVPAMLTCKWDQNAPFYNQCPIYNYNPNIHCLTGAVATAMAQVMYYWKYPAELPALDAYEIENNPSIIVEELPGITLDWGNMRDDYSSSYTTIQADAVAWLMRYCSQAVQTQYSTRFSHADKENIRDAMINFGYSTDATIKYRDDYDATDWHAMMQAELEAGRPILYGAMALNNNIYEDHTFVVDGYNAATNRYHVNFGWSGMYNSFFALDAFIVYDNYSSQGYTFNLNQMMFIGVYPDTREPEAYACYTPENTTLTFYYDKQRSSRTGTTYDLNTGFINPGWIIDGTNANVTKVVFDPSFADVRPTSTYTWFYLMRNLQSITGISYLNTSQVTNMGYMFKSCSSLTSLDLTHFNTESLISMNEMFYYCIGLTELDLSSFNTANVVNMEYMFGEAYNLTRIVVGDEWSTTAVTNSEGMFNRCNNLVGSMGTTYDANHTDKTYAHIDGGPSNPGYLSGKTEAYAVYTAENTTLTFYYDLERASRPGTTYDLNTGSNNPGWYDDNTQLSVTQVVFDPSFAAAYPTTTSSWFRGMYNLQSISGMEYLNTEEVTNMSYMFNQCIYLSSLDLSHFNTAKVTDMTRMFDYCTQLFLVYVGSAWNTDAVTQSSNMFRLCNKLKGGQGTYFSSNNPKDKTYAHIDGGPSNPGYFRDYSISEAYTIYTEDNQTLTFYYDTNRLTRPGTTYDVFPNAGWYNKDLVVKYVVFDQSFELAKPTSTSSWFSEMGSLESITGIRYLKTDSVTDMSYMFFECGLSDLEMNNYLSYFNTAKVKRMEWMFHSCKALTTLDLTNFNTANVTDMSYMFDGCNDLTTIYVGDGWSNESVTNSEKMFMYCLSLVGGQGTTFDYDHVDGSYAHIDGGPSNPGYFTAPIVPSEPEAYACYTPDNTTLTFYYDDQRGSRLGTTYDLNVGARQPDWVLDETNYSVTQVVIDPSFVEARPTSTYSWFFCMENVQSITGLDYLNTDSVTNMAAMFMGSASLTSLDLSHFNTTMVTDMFNMFNECSNLASLDVSGFNTAQVRDMRGMFQGCSMLTSLDLSSFNTARVGHMGMMFLGDSHLSTIYVGSSWSTESINYSAEMFLDCTSLVGGKGTTYDANHVDVEYAHIDGGTSNPGYFTAKVDFIPGDVNGDNSTSISDVTDLIDVLLSGETAPQAADCNGDSNVSISDVTALIDYLLGGSWN
jgi:surface protein